MSTLKISSFKISTTKVSSFQMSTHKVSSFKISTTKVSIRKVSSSKVSSIKDSMNKVRIRKVRTRKVSTGKIRTRTNNSIALAVVLLIPTWTDTTNRGSTNTAAPAILPPNCRRSPASTSSIHDGKAIVTDAV